MLNNIKISQTTNEIILNVNVIAEIHEILEELQTKLPKLRDFYKSSTLPMRVTGRLFTESEINRVTSEIQAEINVPIKFDDVSDLLGLHAIKRTFEADTDISETKFIQNTLRAGKREEYPGSIVVCGDVNSGAEVIAADNIAVLGNLRGLAHAGAKGNKDAIIAASCLDVVQLRISNIVRELDREEEEAV